MMKKLILSLLLFSSIGFSQFVSLPSASGTTYFAKAGAPWIDATGNAWLGADDRANWVMLEIPSSMTPDSVFFFTTAGAVTTDTIYFAIHSYDLSTQYCHTGAITLNGTDGTHAGKFTTTTKLKPGTYMLVYATPNMVAEAPPTTYGLSWDGWDVFMASRGVMNGYKNNALTNGVIDSDLSSGGSPQNGGAFTFPLFWIKGS